MSELPQLVSDLALILIVAGFTTLLCKRLKQPLILGYVLAGFLTGPHNSLFPSVGDAHSIQTWSEIGVIFIMFTLGLEFSFKKIVKMGFSPIIAAVCVVGFMISLGSMVGYAFGWSAMNRLFLGGMLAMSSTTIIYKALEETGLRQRKFANVVLSVLILEDILGILLMVMLSALAASHSFEGWSLFLSLIRLGFFLVCWFVMGIYVVPLFLRRNAQWMNRETLLVVSIGLCFLLVVLAVEAGYSSALGAFTMGSILAETLQAEKIVKVVAPVKDLFGAIFFVSVGMLVDPAVLVDYWLPIVILVLTIIFGQTLLGTLSFLLSGQSLRISMNCGFSLTQIGEFSFILAGLGVSLGVTSEFLYPIVVAVSIITTFTTPYMMRLADPACVKVEQYLPRRLTLRIERKAQAEGGESREKLWQQWSRSMLLNVVTYAVLSVALLAMSVAALQPLLQSVLGQPVGQVVGGVATFLGLSLFLRPLVMKKIHSPEVKQWRKERCKRLLVWVALTELVRIAVALGFVYYIVHTFAPMAVYAELMVAGVLTLAICVERVPLGRSRASGKRRYVHNRLASRVKYLSLRIDHTFAANLRSREQYAADQKPRYANALQKHDIHLAQLHVPEQSAWGGQSLQTLGFGEKYGVMVAAVIRGEGRINIPDGEAVIFPGDVLEVLGDDAHLHEFYACMQAAQVELLPNARPYQMSLAHVRVGKQSELAQKRLADSNIRDEFNCMVVGFEDHEEETSIVLPSADRVMVPGDRIWVVGMEADQERLRRYAAGRTQ